MTQFPTLKNDLIIRAARHEVVERAPVWIMRQAGRYLPEYNQVKGDRDFFQVCRDPELASTITLQPINRFDGLLDAAIIFSDILVIPQALGLQVEMIDGKGPHFPNPLRTPEDLKRINRNADISNELSYVYRAISLTRMKLDGRVPLIGFCGAPWTLMSYMIEGGSSKFFRFAKEWIFKYPELSHDLLNVITEACIEFLVGQVEAGAQLLQVFDSWAGELSPFDFKEFSLPYLQRIAQNVRSSLLDRGLDPVPMIVFAKGAWYAIEELNNIGYDVVGLDWTIDPLFALEKSKLTLQGNMDPNVLYGGREAITRKLEIMVKGFNGCRNGHIINLGHGITPGVNPDDLKFFLEECQRLTTAAQHE